MRSIRILLTLLVLPLALAPLRGADSPAGPFDIREGDRVLFLGDTLLERENTYGAIETRMTEQYRDRHFTVRNLSWSGDTPLGVSRAMFDPPAKGWERLREQIAMVNPTVVFLGYGMAASLQEMTDRSGDITLDPDITRYGREPMSAERFKKELAQLMDAIDEEAKAAKLSSPVRFVLLSPIRHEDLRASRPGLPDPAAHNQLLAGYSKAIEDLATERKARFASLAKLIPTGAANPGAELTSNGIHLSDRGYQSLADSLVRELGWSGAQPANEAFDRLLRETIVRKNQLFFHRFRPENWTYLLGFRKHEQGKNAVEIPEFDPLIAHEEQEIEQLKKAGPSDKEAAPVKPGVPAAAPDPGAGELPKFDIEPGFKIDLWATNPLLEKPIEMNWDSDGRLWVASSNTYPQVNPEDVATTLESEAARPKKDAPSIGNDKILIIEDPDHAGKATRSSVFAEGLLIPTGVAPFRDSQGHWGCYVGASTELIQLVDTKGTGHADHRQIILSGFGTEDTHHIVHTLRWGPDGRLYFDQSIYIHSHFETPWGMVRLNSGGVLAWSPQTERVEVLYKGFCNPWGHAWDEFGQEFMTDGAGGEGIAWGIPGAMYFTYENGRKILQSISPGSYPKFCSLERIHSPLFPNDWQGSFITNDFRAHRIVHFGISDLAKTDDPAQAKSGYITKELPDLVRTGDLSFRPIDVKLGPDGALYVADWSNPVINHGEVDFRDPRRDHHRGRIWRISQAGVQPLEWQKMTNMPTAALFDQLLSNNEWTGAQAGRILAERKPQPASQPAKETDGGAFLKTTAREWAGTDVLKRWKTIETGTSFALPEELPKLFGNASPEIRAGFVKYTGNYLGYPAEYLHSLPEIVQTWVANSARFVETTIGDPNPRVRVEAMRALARVQTARSAALVLDAAMQAPEGDPYYEYAAWLSINDLAEPWAKAAISGEWKVEGHENQLEFALNSIDPVFGTEVLTKVFGARNIPADGGPWLEIIGKTGDPAQLRKLFDALAGRQFNAAAGERAVNALLEAARLRNTRPEGDLSKIETLLAGADQQIGAGAARLMGVWKLPRALEVLKELAGRNNAGAGVRTAAIEGLREIGGTPALAALRDLTQPGQPEAVRRAALVATAETNLDAGVASAAEVLPSLADTGAALSTWRALLRVKGAPEAFTAKLPQNLPPASAAIGLRAARELGKKGEALANLLAAKAGAAADAAKTGQDYKAMIELVKRDGNAARGEMVFRRAQLVCLTCHAIGGAGGKVGPELTSLGASAPLDYIIESVLVPNAKVKEGFNAISLTLKDGTVASGIQSRETALEIFLRDATGQETGVPKANVVTKENIGSIMPAGLVDAVPEGERWDLYAFLSQLGKPGPYDASKGNVARYWALYPASEENKVLNGAAAAAPATPGYTLVDGRFTRELWQGALALLPDAGDAVIAVSKFQLPAAGNAVIQLAGAKEAWLDGKPVNATAPIAGNLAAGEHTLAVKVDARHLPEALRAECDNGRFLGN